MASHSVNFNDIRLIICTQGYNLDYQFIVREIGFCSKFQSGVIPFNCKVNLKELDIKNQRTVYALEDEIHGIRVKKTFDLGLAQSDYKSVLKTLYHSAKSNENDAKYIGIIRDNYIHGLLYRSGLGHLIIDLSSLPIFNDEIQCPSNIDLRLAMKNGKKPTYCHLHEQLRINDIPICAKARAEYFFSYFSRLNE